jgi:hypothetical protein
VSVEPREPREPRHADAFDLVVIGDCNPDVLVLGDDLAPAFGQQEKLVASMSLVTGGSASITATMPPLTPVDTTGAGDCFNAGRPLTPRPLTPRPLTAGIPDGRGPTAGTCTGTRKHACTSTAGNITAARRPNGGQSVFRSSWYH